MVTKLLRTTLVSTCCCLLLIILATTACVESRNIQNRIISGTPAGSGQFPWQVILKLNEMDDLHCGGSVIYPLWVLTAAHCTYGESSMHLTFGTNSLNDDKALSMTSTQLFIHPQYNNANLNNDISLIKLPQALSFGSAIRPIPIVPSAQYNNDFQGTVATIAGFGLTDDEYLDYSQTLLYAQVDIIDNNQCVVIFGKDFVISSTLCAKGDNGSNMSICSGDSGGPLIERDANGNYMQIGINSFVAEDMCTKGYPSGYARLTSYLDYISQTTGVPSN